MIYGLFLDPRTWAIDFISSSFWKPDQYGVHIDLHPDAFRIPEMGIDSKYRFVIATEVWEKPMRRTLQYLRSRGLKVFLAAREPIKHGDLINAMFSYEKFKIGNEYYFTPDVVLAAGQKYADLWSDKTKTIVTGYPRWDWYIDENKHRSKEIILRQHKIETDRKIIFFISYPPYHYKKVDGKDIMIDLFPEHDLKMRVIEQFVKKYDPKYQAVSKIHPAAMKCFLKGTGNKNEVSGLLKRYYQAPTKFFKVIGDVRTSGTISKEIMMCSDFVVGYNSTMLLEAMLVDKPLANVILGKCKDISNPYDDLTSTVYNEKELLNSLEEFNSGFYDAQPVLPEYRKLVEEYIYKIDGKCCERMCDAIRTVVNK